MTARSIVHIEIPASDREASAGFYAELFGWTYEHFSQPMDYTMFQSGNVSGGFPDIGEYYKPGEVVIYIASQDLAADLDRIQSMGGSLLMPPTEVPGSGWMAMFSDPAGNRLALWKSSAES